MISIHALKEYLDLSYRLLREVPYEMPRITAILDLDSGDLPHFTTPCARFQDLSMTQWHVLLLLSAEPHDLGDVQAIDATSMDSIAASLHYAKRTNYTFQAVNTTVMIDCKTELILDIHCSMKQPHNPTVGWQLLKRNLDRIDTITADKGYDW